MIKTIIHPPKNKWTSICKRATINEKKLNTLVSKIFTDVQLNGDNAVKLYTKLFDKIDVKSLSVKDYEVLSASKKIDSTLKNAIALAKKNIKIFHASQKENKKIIETTKGVFCWRESRAIENIGMYIPGGLAPLFSTVLMLGIPAKLAGCKKIILCTPPDKNGNIHPAILYAAKLVGITSIYKVGGIQAIAAMTFGTKSIPKVDKIFGPGNQYVTAAKNKAQQIGVAIDMPAGPSELLVIADATCNPSFVASDLLSQAEHGADSQVIVLATKQPIVKQIITAIEQQINTLPRKEIAINALKNSAAIVLKNKKECIEFSNEYAPEHLIVASTSANWYIPKIMNAGSVFLGNYSCESAGDYASGTNHTLPTNGFSKAYSGVSLDSFIKKITFQQITKEGIENIGPSIATMAEAEQLIAHKNAVSIRLKK